MNLYSHRKPSLTRRFHRLVLRSLAFFAEVPGSLKGHLNTEELARVTIAALSAGGGIYAILGAFAESSKAIFPASSDAALAATLLTFILEVLRRLGHGKELPATPGPFNGSADLRRDRPTPS